MNRLLRAAEGVRPPRYRLIKNSEVIKVGDWITNEATGVANVDATSEAILGLVTAVVNSKKTSLEAFSSSTTSLGGTWVAATKQYTAAADNQTVDGVMAEYVLAKEDDEFVATLSAAKGGTTGSNVQGYFLAVKTTDSSKLDETTAASTDANTQFEIVDPLLGGSTTEVVVRVTLRGTNLN